MELQNYEAPFLGFRVQGLSDVPEGAEKKKKTTRVIALQGIKEQLL